MEDARRLLPDCTGVPASPACRLEEEAHLATTRLCNTDADTLLIAAALPPGRLHRPMAGHQSKNTIMKWSASWREMTAVSLRTASRDQPTTPRRGHASTRGWTSSAVRDLSPQKSVTAECAPPATTRLMSLLVLSPSIIHALIKLLSYLFLIC